MRMRILGLAVVLLGASLAAAWAGDLIPYCRKARVFCKLPRYDYEPQRTTLPNSAPTFAALPLVERPPLSPDAADGALEEEPLSARVWQLAEPELRVNHCAVSRLAVTVNDDGRWIVSFRATQNPYVDGTALPEVRFKRNRFYVSVRAYGAFPLREEPEEVELGKPELFRIDVPPFWIERGDVRYKRFEGRLKPDERRYLNTIDRMEVELRYE